MARISGVDLPRDKRVEIGLTYVYGIGRTSATAIVEAAKDGPFLSKDDFRIRTKASKTVIDLMSELGLLGELPDSNQLSLFDLF